MAAEAVLSEGRHAHHLSCHSECTPTHTHTHTLKQTQAETTALSPGARTLRRGFLRLAGGGELTWMGCHGNPPFSCPPRQACCCCTRVTHPRSTMNVAVHVWHACTVVCTVVQLPSRCPPPFPTYTPTPSSAM